MPPRQLIAGNWKMHRTPSETGRILRDLVSRVGRASPRGEVAVAPPFTSLPAAAEILRGSGIALAAQNVHWEEEGPFTGEVSAKMLAEIACRYVIVGHSERREHFSESDRRINQKVRAVLFREMTPILCVGEKSDERASGRAGQVVDAQMKRGLANIRLIDDQDLVIAYEPVWAIGTGVTATPADAREMHIRIRAELAAAFGAARAEQIRVLYGGSVNRSNAEALLSTPGVDGALVGGASLDPESFTAICAASVR